MDELDELNELRLKIAEKYGWTDIRWDLYGSGPYGFLPNGNPSFIPNWTRDIADAWELVEEMVSVNAIVEVKRNPLIHKSKDQLWWCEVAQLDAGQYLGYGATAPEAISRAHLKWKEAVQQAAQP